MKTNITAFTISIISLVVAILSLCNAIRVKNNSDRLYKKLRHKPPVVGQIYTTPSIGGTTITYGERLVSDSTIILYKKSSNKWKKWDEKTQTWVDFE